MFKWRGPLDVKKTILYFTPIIFWPKEQEEASVKTCYEFGNDPMKMCFKHKTKMKVDHKIKNITLQGDVAKFTPFFIRFWVNLHKFINPMLILG
jgi:hypothetical protein